MSNLVPQMPLPKDFNKFTVARGTGPSHSNLASSLSRATSSGAGALHPLKKYNKTILKGFNNQLVKRNIRRGGLSTTQQTKLYRKMVNENEHLKNDIYAKKVLKTKLLKHFASRPEIQARIKEQYSEDLKGGGKAVRSATRYESTSKTLGKENTKTFSGINSRIKNRPTAPPPTNTPTRTSTPRIRLPI